MNVDARARFPRLLICEGYEDKWFFHHLIQVRALPPFHIWPCAGSGGFAQAIRAFRLAYTKPYNALRDILIVADNDQTPDECFDRVCKQIEQVFGSGTAPSQPLQTARTRAAEPAVTVLMIPWTGERGHLERLCVESARAADQAIGQHVQTFMDLIGADRWDNESRHGKAWLRVDLAGRCERNPFVSLGEVFRETRYHNLIPLNHRSFDRVANVLTRFA